MRYNFDEYIERGNTNCLKYDLRDKFFGTRDLMPLWVADMDFATPQFIREAVIKRAEHPVYGYSYRGESFFGAIIGWMNKRFKWEVEKDWIVFTPGVVPAFNLAVKALTEEKDGILIQPPVYHPFFRAISDHKREKRFNQLVYNEGKYSIDFEDFEKKASESKLFILCHPHNPVGRVWTREELQTMINICREKGVLIVSDEIHSDLMLGNSRHIPLLSLANSHDITLSCYAPSKTFNLAGLSTSFMIIPDEEIRKRYVKTLDDLHLWLGNIFGNTALEAAYNFGEEWLGQLLNYLNQNLEYLSRFVNDKIPEIKVVACEATYLVWLDCSGLGMKGNELKKFIIEEARLGLNDGESFGPGGEGFQRINIALPLTRLEEALNRLKSAVERWRLKS